MDSLTAIAERLIDLVRPWGSIFAFDFGRYLAAALAVTMVLAIASGDYVRRRQVRTRRPAHKQARHELRRSLGAAFVFSLVGLGVYYGAQTGVFRVYSDAARYGWPYWFGSLVLIVLAHDAYFYWTHRALHLPAPLARVHRAHHLSVAPTQWAAYSFSISEAFAQAAFLPIYLLVIPTHTGVLFLWMAHQVLRNVFGHCGVELAPRSWLATWWGRWLTTTLHHDMHHGLGRCNFGLYFTWWDRWCGTEHPDYRRRLTQLIASVGGSASISAHGEEA